MSEAIYNTVIKAIERQDFYKFRALDFIAGIFSRHKQELWTQKEEGLPKIRILLEQVTKSKLNQEQRKNVSMIAAAMIAAQGYQFLFPNGEGDKFAILLVSLASVSIRSSLSNLLQHLSDADYPMISITLAADYDILSASISFLLSDDDDIKITPDNLLTLQKALTLAFSETIQYFRDRYDSARAGALGLSSRNTPLEIGQPLLLNYDTAAIEGGFIRDPMVISGVRALCQFLEADESLRKDAEGIVDFLLDLYKESSIEDDVDYRGWILGAFAALDVDIDVTVNK